MMIAPERDLSFKWAPTLGRKRGLSLSGAEAGGADTLWVQHPAYQRHSNDIRGSVKSHGQDSAYGSNYDIAEDLRDPKDGSGTEHADLPPLPESAEHEQEEDDSLLEKSESWPRDGIGEESQDSHDGSATKGTELPQVQDPVGHKWRDANWESEIRPRKGKTVVKVSEGAQDPRDGLATKGTELPQVQDPVGHRQGEAASLLEHRESWPGDGIGERSQDGSATGHTQRNNFRGCLALGEWFKSHPVLTLALLIVLPVLAFVFGVSLAPVSAGRRQTEIPLTSDSSPLLACLKGWIGYRGICYFFSRDHRSWDQAQALCSGLGASLAVPKDMDMRFLSCLSGNVDVWLGLRRRDQGLQWVDGSSFNSSVKVLGNGECVFLGNGNFWSGTCSNLWPYLCSKPQRTL